MSLLALQASGCGGGDDDADAEVRQSKLAAAENVSNCGLVLQINESERALEREREREGGSSHFELRPHTSTRTREFAGDKWDQVVCVVRMGDTRRTGSKGLASRSRAAWLKGSGPLYL